jgi:hypothetical protein
MSDDNEKQLGIIAVRRNFISPEQLIEGYLIQAQEDEEKGNHRLIGEILLDLGYINTTQLQESLRIQKELQNGSLKGRQQGSQKQTSRTS